MTPPQPQKQLSECDHRFIIKWDQQNRNQCSNCGETCMIAEGGKIVLAPIPINLNKKCDRVFYCRCHYSMKGDNPIDPPFWRKIPKKCSCCQTPESPKPSQPEKKLKVLVACEFSGIVREAFRKRGFDAWSCDLLPSEIPSPYHIQGDVLEVLDQGWDLMIAHPPCTHLAVSGAAWFKNKVKEQKEALDFVQTLLNAPMKYIALENPVSVISSKIRKPDQIVQPFYFGHSVMKTTCLWLKNLPKLKSTKIVNPEYVFRNGKKYPKWSYETFCLPKKRRAHERSRTFQGIADAMAEQWGRYLTSF